MLRFSGRGVTDVGRVRDGNEDSAFVGPYVALVADGVGGAAAGEVASATVAYVVSAVARMRHRQQPAPDPEQLLTEAIDAARDSLRIGVDQDLQRSGMATTLTAVVTDGHRVVLGHVGDSRAYLLRAGELSQLSTDHTYVQQLVTSGQLQPESVKTHPWRNVVLRSLHGGPLEVGQDADVVTLDLVVGDRLVLCSDGLTDLVADPEITALLAARDPGEDPESAAGRLVAAALEAGGSDNVTVVVLDLVDGPAVVGDGQVLGAMADLANVVDPAAVRAV